MRADFTQTDRNGQRVSGVLTLKRPGKIRFEYEKGVNMLIVSNGSSLTLIDYDVQQVVALADQEFAARRIARSKRDVDQRYGKLQPTSNPDVISVEVRDTTAPEYGVITLIFVRERRRARRARTVELGGARRAEQAHHGAALGPPIRSRGSDSAFKYRDPRTTARRQG